MRMTKRSTVIDVAKAVGVSPSTVSRYFRGITVAEGVGARIAEASARLQYQPDETARALRGGRTRTLGAIIPQVTNSFYAQAVQLIEDEAHKRGYAVILLTHQENAEQQAAQLSTLRRYRADGLILAPAAGSTAEGIRNVVHGMPVVAIDRFLSPAMDSVVLRNHDAARTATEHLLQHGYKRIACLLSRREIMSFEQRWNGYKEALESRRKAPILIEAPNHDELRYHLCSALLSRKGPDALLCFSNRATRTALQAYDELALPKTSRLPLLGFDDFEMAAMVDPAVSVVRQPVENIVRHAISILFERIAGNDSLEMQNVALPGEMIYRHSCGCK